MRRTTSRSVHRPFLSLFFCLALAVNLLAPFASASPLFVEICSGHETRLVLADDAPDVASCETCMVCCVGLSAPDTHAVFEPTACAIASGDTASHPRPGGASILPNARAPPFPTV